MPARCPPRLLKPSKPKRLLSSGRCLTLGSKSWSPTAAISFIPALRATPDRVHPKHLSTTPFTDYSVIIGRVVSIVRGSLFGLRCLFLFRHSRIIDLRYDASSRLRIKRMPIMKPLVYTTRCLHAPGIITALVFCSTVSLSADSVFTPFIGKSYGENDTEKVTTLGASLAAMAGGVFGFEIDFARTAKASSNTVFVENSRATTAMGNLIVGVPVKGVRPYVVGGMGWMKTEVLTTSLSKKTDGLAIAVGGGVMGFLSEHVGARFDLRYTRAISIGESIRDVVFETPAFWRASWGLALRF